MDETTVRSPTCLDARRSWSRVSLICTCGSERPTEATSIAGGMIVEHLSASILTRRQNASIHIGNMRQERHRLPANYGTEQDTATQTLCYRHAQRNVEQHNSKDTSHDRQTQTKFPTPQNWTQWQVQTLQPTKRTKEYWHARCMKCARSTAVTQ